MAGKGALAEGRQAVPSVLKHRGPWWGAGPGREIHGSPPRNVDLLTGTSSVCGWGGRGRGETEAGAMQALF